MAEQQGSSSKAGEPSAANVFSGERSKEGYALTNAELFKLVDKVVYPGHADGDEVKGKQSEADRFAKAVCGTPSSSGYTRVSTMRTKTNVKREYDSLQEYQCATCKRNLAANLALRPPTEKMRVYIPGPDIPQSSSTPIYLWPRGNSRHRFGEEWKRGATQDALSKLYQDYYNIKWTDAVLTHLQSAKGHSYKTPFT